MITTKTRKCRNKACCVRFPVTEQKPFAVACSIECEIVLAKQYFNKLQAARAKVERADIKVRKEAIKTRTDWLNEAQAIFNRYIRLRDAAEPCISCGRFHTGKWNAGHYKSVKAHPELRFSEFNVHKQCEPCNTNLSGNVSKYRARLVEVFGEQMVSEQLETHIKFAGWTIDDAKAIKAKYKHLVADLLKAQA